MQYTSKLATVVCNVMGENLSFIFPKKCTKFNPKKIAFIRSSIWLRNKTSPFTTLPSRWKSNLNTRQFSTHAHVEYNSTVEAATIKTNTKNGSCGSHFPVMSFFHLGGHCQPGCYWRRGFIPPACHVILGVSRAPSAADTLSDILYNPWMWIWSGIHLMGTHSHARTPPQRTVPLMHWKWSCPGISLYPICISSQYLTLQKVRYISFAVSTAMFLWYPMALLVF